MLHSKYTSKKITTIFDLFLHIIGFYSSEVISVELYENGCFFIDDSYGGYVLFSPNFKGNAKAFFDTFKDHPKEIWFEETMWKLLKEKFIKDTALEISTLI